MTSIINGAVMSSMIPLGKFTYSAGGKEVVKIEQDLVVNKFIIKCKGDLIWTGDGSGTLTKPEVHPYGIMHGLVENITIARKGTDKFREYDRMRHISYTQDRNYGQKDGILYKQNANDLQGSYLEGLPVFPATTQKLQFAESQVILMENINSSIPLSTRFSTKDLSTATITIKFGQLADIKDPEGTSTAPITTNGIEFEVFALCSDYLLNDPNIGKADWAQTPEELEFAGAQKGQKHFLSPEGLLQGMLVTGINANGKYFSIEDMNNTLLEISYLGVTVKEGSMLALLEADSAETHVVGRKRGSCYVNFMDAKQFRSGLPIVDGKKLEVKVTTAAGVSFPARLIFEYDQLIFDPTAIPSAKSA